MPQKFTYEELKRRVRELEQEEREQQQLAAELRLRVIELEGHNQEMVCFVSRISQELHEPLGAVRRYLQFVDARYKDRLDPDAASFIESAVDAANKMQALVGELLVYLRSK